MKYIILLCLILINSTSYCQWERTSWQSTSGIGNIFSSDSILIFSTNDGLLISNNYGISWVQGSKSLVDIGTNFVLFYKHVLFAGGFGFLEFSTDMGETWVSPKNGLPSFPIVNAIVGVDDIIFAGTDEGIFRSSDFGETWQCVNNNLGNSLIVGALSYSDHNVWATPGNEIGLALSTDYGESWINRSNGLPTERRFNQIINTGNLIYIRDQNDPYNGMDNEVFVSSDQGDNWTLVETPFMHRVYSFEMAAINDKIFISVLDSLFYSSDRGVTWQNITGELPHQLSLGIDKFYFSGDRLYAISCSEIYVSSDEGASWKVLKTALNYSGVYDLAVINNKIFAGASPTGNRTTYQDGIFCSTDYGEHWVPKGLKYLDVTSIFTNGDNVYAIANWGNFKSTDQGDTWLDKNVGFPDSTVVYDMAFGDNTIYAAMGWKGIKVSTDEGKTWETRNKGLPINYSNEILSLAVEGNYIFAGTDSAFYLSNDKGNSWVKKTKGLPPDVNLIINQIEVEGNQLWIVTKFGIYYSDDLAESWTKIFDGVNLWGDYDDNYNCKLISAGNLYVTKSNDTNGFYISTDNGKSWNIKNEGIPCKPRILTAISLMDDEIYAGSMNYNLGERGDGIFKAKISDLISGVNDKVPKKGNLDISPNPVTDNLQLKGSYFGDKIQIYSMLGQVMLETEYSDQIDVSSLAPGVYFLKLNDKMYKFVKI